MSWPAVQITEVARVVGGATPKSAVADYWDGEVNWVTPKDLSKLEGKYIAETPRKITTQGLSSCAAELLPANSVLFSSRAPIGHVAINSEPMATNQGFKSFIPGPELDSSFLYWWLDANRDMLQSMGTGATFKEVSKAVVQRIKIPFPPLEEQRRIAGILDQADALRRLRTRALDKLNTLGQAIFHEMFGRSGGSENDVVDLGSMLTFVTSGGRGWAKYYSEEGARFLRSLDVQMNAIGNEDIAFVVPPDNAEARRTRVEKGDVLLTITGSKIGRSAALPDKLAGSYISQHVAILRPDLERVLPTFLSYFLSMEQFGQKQIKAKQYGQAKPGLNFEQIRSFQIPNVSIERQRDFVGRLGDVAKAHSTSACGKEKFEALFVSLQDRAFRGQL